MYRYIMRACITRACVAAAAAVALSTVGLTAASAAGMSARVPRAVRAPSERASRTLGRPGTQLWVKRYNGGNGIDDATSETVSPDGKTVFVTGYSAGVGANAYDYATVAYDAVTGAQLWVKRYNGPGNGDDRAYSVTVSPDGSTVFVAGSSYGGSATSYDYATVAYNAVTGAQLWVKRYNGPAAGGTDEATSVAVSQTGSTTYVTGYSYATATGGYNYATVAYNAVTGAQLWVKRYATSFQNYAHAVVASGNTVFVTGVTGDKNDGGAYATVAYNATTGAQQWVKRYNGATGAQRGANSVAVSPDGKTVFVTGSSNGGATTGFDYATVAYNATTGAQQWVKRYNGPGSGDDQAYSVAVSPTGSSVFVTGYSWGGSAASFDYATVAYNATTGAQQWVKRYNGALGLGNNQAFSVAVSPPGGTVYVTGSGDADSNYATVAYSATTGAQQWAKRYTGPGPDGGGATWAAVSPTTGTVYVTGHSSGNGTGYDYATVAYQG